LFDVWNAAIGHLFAGIEKGYLEQNPKSQSFDLALSRVLLILFALNTSFLTIPEFSRRKQKGQERWKR